MRAKPVVVRVIALAVTALLAGLVVAHSAPTARAAGAGYWHTSGSRVLDANNQPVRIAGINWYGFETPDAIVHGLWAQDYHAVINDIAHLGYNVIRLPFSNQMVESNPVPSNYSLFNTGPINTDLKGLTALQIMDKIIAYAGQVGLKVILDDHRSEAGNSAEQNGLWYTSAYPTSAWVNDWASLARRYQGNTTVVGVDLRNEPHTPTGVAYSGGATWGTGDPNTDWQLAAQQAGNAVLGVNPHLLVAVEGIGEFPNASGGFDSTWWGGQLEGAASHPVTLSVPSQLVYSAHDYGPNLFQQAWFNSSTTFASLSAVWDKNWGYLYNGGTAPLWVGEFGTTNNAADVSSSAAGSQGQWFSSLVQYIANRPAMGWTYWALNGEDSYALLDGSYDATPPSAQKQALLAGIQLPLSPPPTPTPSGSVSPTAAPSVSLQIDYLNASPSPSSNQESPHLQVLNTGNTPIALNLVTIKYWFQVNDPSNPSIGINFFCDYAALGCANVTGTFAALSPTRTGADHALTVGFSSGAGSVPIAGTSGEIQARIAKADWSAFNGSSDYSWGAVTAYTAWPHITAYYQGKLVWGTEP